MPCRFLYTNVWDDMTLVASSEETNLPAENTQQRWPTRVWRSTTVATIQTIEGDYGSAVAANCAVIKKNNFSSGARVQVRGHDFVVVAPILSGSELVTNGGFGADTSGWSAGNSASLSSVAGGESGNCLQVAENGVANPYAYQAISGLTVGNSYQFSFYIKKGTANNFQAYINCSGINYGPAAGGRPAPAGWTQYTIVFRALATTATIYLWAIAGLGSAQTQLFDSVSLQRITNGSYVNNLINYIDNDGYQYWAYIPGGTYTDWDAFATAVGTCMDEGPGNYTVTYAPATGKFTITVGAGTFTLKWGTGLSIDFDASELLGFAEADKAGAATYTSDNSIWDTATFYGNFASIDNDTMVLFFGSIQTWRHWQVRIDDTSNPDGHVEMGRVYLGTYFEPTAMFLEGYAESRQDLSAATKSEGGQISCIVRPTYSVRDYEFVTTEKSSFDAVFTSRGLGREFFFCEDSTNAPQDSMRYVRIAGWSWRNETGASTYRLGLSLEDLL